MSPGDLIQQTLEVVIAVLIAPLLVGWVNQCRAWLQNRTGAGIWQPYQVLHKLFRKDAVVAHNASALFRVTPYIVFASMVLAASLVPMLATALPFAAAADVIALVGLLALARVFMALAAMDVGTAFGSFGARREMLVAALAEPALLMVFFMPALIARSTSLGTIVERIPIDNPTTHLELTMIHEAMILEYSGRHLALMEWAHALKLVIYSTIGVALFLPWGIAEAGDWPALPLALLAITLKLLLGGAALAVVESVSAKLRIFRAPEFLASAFLFAVLGVLTHLLLAGRT
jgi:formate hydrogenlyase subunit 4